MRSLTLTTLRKNLFQVADQVPALPVFADGSPGVCDDAVLVTKDRSIRQHCPNALW